MNQAEKKCLDTSRRYLLENISMTREFHAALTEVSVFTNEMLNKIWSYTTSEERIGEMVEQLKRRGEGSFDLFVDALRNSNQDFIADHLYQQLKDQPREPTTNRSSTDPESRRRIELSKLSKDELINRVITRENDFNDLDELHNVLKDDFEATIDELSYVRQVTRKLRQANELELKANDAMHNRYSQNASQLSQTICEKDRQISECHQQIERVETQLSEVESSYNKAIESRRRLANKLKLGENATDEEISAKIDHLKQSEVASRDRMERAALELKRLQKDFDDIDEQKNTLTKRVKLLNQKLHTLDLQKKRHEATYTQTITYPLSCRSIKTPGNSQTSIIGQQQPTLINIEWPSPSSSPLLPRSRTTMGPTGRIFPPVSVPARYCILCRQVYHNQVGSSTDHDFCRIHYRAFRENSYECCRNNVSHSTGCLTVRHLFVDVSSPQRNHSFSLTDGCNFRLYADRRGFVKATFD